MPRNSSGTYSLYTPGNPVVPSTVITTTWANNTLSDLATAMTDSLSRSGDGGMLAPLELAAGAVGAPGLSWSAEPTSGIYRASSGNFRYSVSGADVTTWTAAGFAVTGTLSSSGAATLNSLGVTGNATVGGTLGVTGNTTVGGTLGVTGNTSITAGLLMGSATGGNQGAGTVNAVGVYDDGVLLANQTGANPSASIGLSAVNGSAGTFMRSDAAPALSVSIAPTWTGQHTFASTSGTWNTNTNPSFYLWDTDSSANSQVWRLNAVSDSLVLSTRTDANGVGQNVFAFARSGTTVGNMDFGNATANNAFRFLGTGTATFSGAIVGATATGGAQGAGTINATAVYDDGLQIYPNIPRSTTTTTLVAGDLGKCVAVSANIAIPASVFSAGDAITIYNDSASAIDITIAAGTLRYGGTTSTGTRTLAPRGLATLWFNVGGGTPEVIATGAGLS